MVSCIRHLVATIWLIINTNGKMYKRHYLVTGGTGFLGSSLVHRLLKEGNQVRVLDNNSRGAVRRLSSILKDIELINADIRDPDAVSQAIKGVDVVVHMAAVNGTEFFYSSPELVLDVSIRGILAVVDGCRANGIGELSIASSSEVYQEPNQFPTGENVPLVVPDVLNPRYSYAGGKILSELVAINYGRKDFDRLTIFRPHNVYGSDMGWEHVIPQLIIRAMERIKEKPAGHIPIPIQGDGKQRRAFIHIEDFTESLIHVLEHGNHMNIYNLGNPEETTISEVANQIISNFGRKAKLVSVPEPKGATKRRCPDISKIAALGFIPKISFEAGLPDVIDWYTHNLHLRTDERNQE